MRTSRAIIFFVAVSALACGNQDVGVDQANASDNKPTTEGKTVERVEISESRFKPAALESAVDELVTGIEAATITDDVAVGVVLKSLNQFWRPVSVGATRALAELEVAGAVQGSTEEIPDVSERVAQEKQFIEEQRALDYDAFAIAPHNDDLSDLIDSIASDGHPVVTIDSDLPDTQRSLYVGTDNPRAGATGAQSLLNVMDGAQGRVLVLGNTDAAWVAGYERTNSAVAALEDAGNQVEILNSIWVVDDDVAQLVAAMQDDSSGLPLVGMLGVFANAHTCATAALQAGVEPKPAIIAFDSEPETLAYLEDGVIAATHVQRQYYMGYLSVYLAYSIKTLGLDQTKGIVQEHLLHGFHLDTGLDVIRTADVVEYDTFMGELGI